jgi:predicted nuclease of predicted toxin-antitoxin system
VARLYADENFPRPVVEALRTLAHDVLTMQETGTAGAAMSDREVLSFAISQARAVLTINRRDFIRLHATDPAHAGIIVCTLDLDFAGQAARIDAAVAAHTELRGLLLRVNRTG